ncbi:T6SS phospholipase effector Tle1-like catalytic domain-containing protein [Marimonas arenosa]|uniref:DUF2235 domain-containing protein n=1 Tax=Marimonas arenosa TaxID=1795305 RepID=A0AAE3WAU7_9RHOB|nr:DUF2235 domain-containing protein [Marimonas arenosa]MDQ2088412.1 DUF2235 domain-containing protein [Marimonas arenosa]
MTKIILCIDGTGNEIGDRESNVLKLYKALDKDDADQQAHYFMGVGTYDGPQFFGRTRQAVQGLLGQAFGYGLEDDVLQAYRTLCRTYRTKERKQKDDPGLSDDAAENDHIYIVGFSRGAYAARVLAGFIHNFGLVDPSRLHLITPVFRAYRRVTDFEKTEKDDKVFQALREYEHVLDPTPAAIRALMLFDTVSSIIRFRRPLKNLRSYGSLAELGTHASVNANVSVRIVLHALSIHDRRSLFRAQHWQPELDDTGAPLYFGNNFRNPKAKRTQYVVQRWFPGYHSDVGGSPREDESGLGKISLLWMLDALEKQEKQADKEDNAARKRARRAPLPGPRKPGLRLKRGNRKWYLEGDTDKKTPGGYEYAKPEATAKPHNSHTHGVLAPLWCLMEFFPKSLKRREKGTVKWYRRAWLFGIWYLPLFEPRHIPEDHEIDPSAEAHPR